MLKRYPSADFDSKFNPRERRKFEGWLAVRRDFMPPMMAAHCGQHRQAAWLLSEKRDN